MRAINSTSQTLTAHTYIKNISSRIPNAGTNPRKYVFARSTGKHHRLLRSLASSRKTPYTCPPALTHTHVCAYVYVNINCYYSYYACSIVDTTYMPIRASKCTRIPRRHGFGMRETTLEIVLPLTFSDQSVNIPQLHKHRSVASREIQMCVQRKVR